MSLSLSLLSTIALLLGSLSTAFLPPLCQTTALCIKPYLHSSLILALVQLPKGLVCEHQANMRVLLPWIVAQLILYS